MSDFIKKHSKHMNSATMKRKFIICILSLCTISTNSQTVNQLFKHGEVNITWLGIDFSHVRIIGDFSQFSTYGERSTTQIRDKYFPGWNHLFIAYPKKYNIRGMLRQNDINFELNLFTSINSKAPLDSIESFNVPNYSIENIRKFVSEYRIENKEGIGVFLIAECLNKPDVEAIFHFVAINMKTKEILIHERLKGKPSGLGVSNYWASAIYDVIKVITKKYYKIWLKKYM